MSDNSYKKDLEIHKINWNYLYKAYIEFRYEDWIFESYVKYWDEEN